MSTAFAGSSKLDLTIPSEYGAITVTSHIFEKDSTETIIEEILPLGVAKEERRFWFQRARAYDADAIATLVWMFLSHVQFHTANYDSQASTTTPKQRNSISHDQIGRMFAPSHPSILILLEGKFA